MAAGGGEDQRGAEVAVGEVGVGLGVGVLEEVGYEVVEAKVGGEVDAMRVAGPVLAVAGIFVCGDKESLRGALDFGIAGKEAQDEGSERCLDG